MSRNTSVEGANSGGPLSPPASRACGLRRSGGRATVVFDTMMPSTPEASATAAMSARSCFSEIGRDLDEQRHLTLRRLARRDQLAQQRFERIARLQVAQPRRIRGRHIDHEIIGDRGAAPHALDIVGQRVGAVAVAADIDPDGPAPPGADPQTLDNNVETAAVEPEPVDQRAIGIESKDPRARIAGLRKRRDRADLDKAETEPQQRIGHARVLVETGRNADRVRKVAAPEMHPQHRRINRACPSAKPRRERSQGQKMRRLGRQRPQKRRTERKKIGHLLRSRSVRPCRGPRPRPRRDRRETETGSAPCCRSSRSCRPGAACRRRPACWRASRAR